MKRISIVRISLVSFVIAFLSLAGKASAQETVI
ncbi:MAG: hypothetical protein HW415_146 [Deltaproteobacteria bacterium]|nr:hypothetical protein [Deltaproteobacteria bacterium]